MAIKTVIRYVLAAAIALGGLAPAYSQQAYFRVTSSTIRGGLENTSPDGITVVLPSANRKMRHAIEGELSGPVVYGNDGEGTWSLKSGALPAGTELVAESGAVRGTPDAIGVSPGIVLGYEDATGRKGESVPFSISVVPQPEISYEDDLVAQGHRYTQAPELSDVIGAASFEVVSGELPGGLTLDESTGMLSGTPLQLGVWPGLVVRVTDSDGATDLSPSFELEIVEGGVIEYQSPVVVKRGALAEIVPFVDEMTAPVAFAVADGVTLPEGFVLDEETGIISGSTDAVGVFEGLQIVGDDANGKPAASNLFDIEVADFSLSYDVQPFQSNTPVSFLPVVVGGAEPFVYSLPEGMLLPPGLLLDEETGIISGSVAEVGVWEDVVVAVSDDDGDSILSAPIDFTTLGAMIAYADANVAMGEPVGMEPVVAQMRAPVAFAMMDGELPYGVALDEETGVISGATEAAGDFPMMVMATDADEKTVVSEPFMLSVDVPAIGANNPDARGRVGLPFYYSTGSDGLVAPITWELIGNALPPGLSLDDASGVIEGVPLEVGFFEGLDLRATDVNGNVVESGAFTIEIAEPALLYADPSTTSVEQASTISPTRVEIEPDATYVSAGAPLPDGLSINPFNGDIEGQPVMDGVWSGISVMVIEPQGWIFNSNEFSIVVGDVGGGQFSIPDYSARVGVAFATDAPQVTTVSGPHSWVVSEGLLPDGLVLDSQTGVISGVPEFPGIWPGIALTATGSDGAATSNAFSISVSALSVSVTDVYYGRVDRPFSAAPEVSGATGEVSWQLLPMSPPDGVDFWSNSGTFEGTPTTEGTYGEYVVRVTDESGAEATSLPFLIVIEPALPAGGGVIIDVQSIIRARPGVDFGLRPDPEGAVGGVTWTLVGTLPPGLTFNGASGRISGQPTAIGLYDGLQIRASDTSGQNGTSPFFGIDVQQVPGVQVTPDSYAGEVGTPMTIVATHDEQVFGSMEWRLVGRAPFGMRMDTLTGRLTGTPLEPGVFGPLQIKLTDADGAVGLSNPFTITTTSDIVVDFPTAPGVSPNQPEPGEEVEPGSPEAGSPGTPGNPGSPPTVRLPGTTYTTREGIGFTTPRPGVNGDDGSVRWEVASGSLPPGMSLDAGSGRIFGTALASGTWAGIYLRLEDGNTSIVGGPINIVVLGDIVVTAPASVTGRVARPITFTPKAQGLIGSAYWRFQDTGLPLGLAINSATGLVSITPTSDADISNVRFRATDSYDGSSGVSTGTSFLIHPDIEVGAPVVMPATAGLEFTMAAPTVTGIVGTARWSIVGSLPPGLSINASTGQVSGIPTQGGTWPLRLRVTDSVDNAFANSPSFNIVVAAVPAPGPNGEPPVLVPLLVDYAAGYTAYTTDSFTTDRPTIVGADGPVGFIIPAESAPLPSWASLNGTTGEIVGTPEETGSWSGILVRASDGVDTVTDGPLTITARGFEVTAPAEIKGRVGTAMSFKGTAAVAKGATSWQIATGSLPPGLSINAGSGTISGTPTTAFLPVEITLRATDSVGRTDVSDAVSIAVDPTVVVPATYRGTVGSAFTTTAPSLVGTTGAVSWSLSSGSLPSWASLNASTGRITGTPDAAGTIVGLSLRGTHSATGLTATSGTFSIEVTLPKLVVSGGPGHVRERIGIDVQFDAPTASGNIGTVSWSIVRGTPPAWMSLIPTTGVVSTSSSQPGSSGALALRATDGTTGVTAETATFSVNYVADPVASVIASASGMAGTAMTVTPVASNIIGTPSWTIQSGTLPAGLSLNPSSGTISGTPTNAAVGTHSGISLRVVDSHDGHSATTGMLSIVIAPNLSVTGYQAQHVTHPTLPLSTPTPTLVNATGSVSWSLASGTLPSGMSLSSATGVIAGTPTQAGVFTVVVRGTDVQSGGSALSKPIQIRLTTLTAAMGTSFNGTVTQPFAAAPTVANAIGSVSWAIDAGTLPSWASFDAATGRISGTPDEEATHTGLRLRVTDSTGITAVTGNFSIAVVRSFAVAISPTSYSGRVGVPLTLSRPVVQNVMGTLVWTVQGTLPAGMGMNPSTGTVSGTPTAPGTSIFKLMVTDSGDGSVGETPTISVSVEDVPAISVEDLYTGRMNADFLAAPTVVRANGTRTWSVISGSLPPGLVLSSSGGTISGSATQVGQRDDIVLRVVDSQGASGQSEPFSIRIDPGITASIPTTSYAIRMGNALTLATPAATNVLGTVVWSANGALPAGMSISSSTGIVSGTPTSPGSYAFTLQARDTRDNAKAWTQQVSVVIHGALAITGGKSSYGTHVNIPVATQAYGVVGARGTVAWSIASGSLPSWASLDTSTGVVSGTPTTSGNVASVSLRATDSYDGSTVVGPAFSIVVLDRMLIGDMATNYYARVSEPFSSFPPSAAPVGGDLDWYMHTGALPSWASLNARTGVITGTPPAAGTTSYLRLGARDDYGADERSIEFNLNVRSAPTMTPSVLLLKRRIGIAGGNITFATDSISPNPIWSLSGTLPSGMTMNASNGTISGTVSTGAATGAYNVEVSVQDPIDYYTASEMLQVQVGPAMTFGTPVNRTVRAEVPFSFAPPTYAGVVGNAQWSTTASLGGSASIDPDTGVISGMMSSTASGVYRIRDSWDNQLASSASFSITVTPAMAASVSQNAFARANVVPDFPVPTATNAVGGVTWSLNAGSLPPGISVDPSSGDIVGTTTETGTWSGLTLRATDSEGVHAISNSFYLRVYDDVQIANSGGFNIGQGQAYGASFSATNYYGSLTWSMSGTLPANISFLGGTRTSAVISGTTNAAAGNYPISITATDGSGVSFTENYTLVVAAPAKGYMAYQAGTHTFTPPAGASSFRVWMIGGGAGGGSGIGGPGGVATTTFTATEPLTVTVGNGGSGIMYNSGSGTPGQPSSLKRQDGSVILQVGGGTVVPNYNISTNYATSVKSRTIANGATGAGGTGNSTSRGSTSCDGTTGGYSTTYYGNGSGGRYGLTVNGSAPSNSASNSRSGSSGTGYGAGGGSGSYNYTYSPCYGSGPYTYRAGSSGVGGYMIIEWGY